MMPRGYVGLHNLQSKQKLNLFLCTTKIKSRVSNSQLFAFFCFQAKLFAVCVEKQCVEEEL